MQVEIITQSLLIWLKFSI